MDDVKGAYVKPEVMKDIELVTSIQSILLEVCTEKIDFSIIACKIF